MRRIVRPARSQFRVGDRVRVDGDYNGDYFGVVIEATGRLRKIADVHDMVEKTAPGVGVRVHRWEGQAVDFEIIAFDTETQLDGARA